MRCDIGARSAPYSERGTYLCLLRNKVVKAVPKLRALTGDITPSTNKCAYHYGSCTKLLQRFETCCTWACCNVLQAKCATMYARVDARKRLRSVLDLCRLRNKYVKVVRKVRALTGDITLSTINCPYNYGSCTKSLQRIETCRTSACCNVLQGTCATMYAKVAARKILGSVITCNTL